MTIALDEKQYEEDLKEAYKLGYEQGMQGYHDGSFHYLLISKTATPQPRHLNAPNGLIWKYTK